MWKMAAKTGFHCCMSIIILAYYFMHATVSMCHTLTHMQTLLHTHTHRHTQASCDCVCIFVIKLMINRLRKIYWVFAWHHRNDSSCSLEHKTHNRNDAKEVLFGCLSAFIHLILHIFGHHEHSGYDFPYWVLGKLNNTDFSYSLDLQKTFCHY